MAEEKTQAEIVEGYRRLGMEVINDMVTEINRLRAGLEDAVDTLEAMDMHTDNALYDRLRAVLEPT
jgi:hypothetical protein